jgi:phage baseplate assembly protein V
MSNLLIDAIRRLTELERRQASTLRLGTIAEADYKRARVRVKIGPLLTAWLPWLTHRASKNITWHAPEVGEQVLVLAPSGELTNAVVLPAIYQSAYPAPTDNPDIARLTFDDGAVLEYDRAAHKLTADIPGSADIKLKKDITATIGGNLAAKISGNADLTAGGNLSAKISGSTNIESTGSAILKAPTVTIDSPATKLTGALTVAGLLTYQGGMSGSGGAGGAAAAIDGGITATGDIKSGSVTLQTHVHAGVQSGSSKTTPAQPA